MFQVCEKCPVRGVKQFVPSEIKPSAKFVLIAEAPGAEEVIERRPMVGPSGKLNDYLMYQAGLYREDVDIINVCSCYPKASPDEIELFCRHRLYEELKPLVHLPWMSVGEEAIKAIHETDKKITPLRGKIHPCDKVADIIPGAEKKTTFTTFHPAYVLRSGDRQKQDSNPSIMFVLAEDYKVFARTLSGRPLIRHTPEFTIAKTEMEINAALSIALRQEILFLDLETTSLDRYKADVILAQFSCMDGTYVMQFYDNPAISPAFKYSVLQQLFALNNIPKVFQNGKYDIGVLRAQGIQCNNFYFDSFAAHCVLRENLERNHALDDIALWYLNYSDWDVSGFISGEQTYADIPPAVLLPYSATDVDVLREVFPIMMEELHQRGMLDYFINHAMKSFRSLIDMEERGVLIDVKKASEVERDYVTKIESEKVKLFRIAGEEFNPNSTKQLRTILFEKLKLKPIKQTKKGNLSTDAEVLEQLNHPIADSLMSLRRLNKICSTYLSRGMLSNLYKNRVHCSYKFGPATGRLASEDPNLQNIPRLGGIRPLFIAPEGFCFLSTDYRLAEMFVLAFLSGSEQLERDCEKDVHRKVAAMLFKISEEAVTSEQRVLAKFIDFGIIYGRTAESIAEENKIPVSEAQVFIDMFLSHYAEVRQFREGLIDQIFKVGYLENLFGKKRHFPPLQFFDHYLQEEWIRVGYNFPCQSNVAELTLRTGYMVTEELKKANAQSGMIMNLHDGLVFEVHLSELDAVKSLVEEVAAMPLPKIGKSIPFEFKLSDYWEEKE